MNMNGYHQHQHQHPYQHQQQLEFHYMNNAGYAYPAPAAAAAAQGFTGFFGCAEHAAPYHYLNVGPTNAQESEYWAAMHMNSYKYGISGQETAAYYGLYGTVDHGPRMDFSRTADWDGYPSLTNVEDSAVVVDLPSEQIAEDSAAVDFPSQQNVVPDLQYVAEEIALDEEDDVNTQVLLQDDIDPDTMTYEELLDLGEAVGAQSRGLSQELINRLPTSKHKSGGIFSRKKSEERCVICQMRYKRGDRQINLPCKHAYHTDCGSKWLSINKTCPVCNTEVFGDESSY